MTRRDEHTPGPWTLGSEALIVTDDAWRRSVAIVYNGDTAADGPDYPQMWANARLIAAAPALLEAAETALHQLTLAQQGALGDEGHKHLKLDALRSAIAQATGSTRLDDVS